VYIISLDYLQLLITRDNLNIYILNIYIRENRLEMHKKYKGRICYSIVGEDTYRY